METFCGKESECLEVLEPYLECASNETRASKDRLINQLKEKCDDKVEGGTKVVEAWALMSVLLVTLTLALI